MTDDRDELASAHLDGQTSPEEDARIAREPDLQARVDAFRAVARQVGEPVAAAPEEARDAAITAAITAAIDAAHDEAPARDHPGQVLPHRRGPARWLAVAAAVLVALALVPALGLLDAGTDSSDDMAADASGDEPTAESAEDADDGAGAYSADAELDDGSDQSGVPEQESLAAPLADAGAELVELGPVADLDALDARLDWERSSASTTAEAGGGGAGAGPAATSPVRPATVLEAACLAELLEWAAESPSESAVLLQGTAELDGATVLVVATEDLVVVGAPAGEAGAPGQGCATVTEHRRTVDPGQ